MDCAPYGCDDPWCMSCEAPQVYDSEVGCCGACVDPAPPTELWCPGSPEQHCRMMCEEPQACPDGQCNMREGTCCEASCQPYAEPRECTGCCPEGATCFAPDPPCCAERTTSSGTTSSSGSPAEGDTATACAIGEDCGGQVNQDCGSACPPVCGEEQAMCSACPSATAASEDLWMCAALLSDSFVRVCSRDVPVWISMPAAHDVGPTRADVRRAVRL